MAASRLGHPALWRGIGWALILAVVYLSLTPKPPPATVAFGDKFSHLAGYAGLMAWWLQVDGRACRQALFFILMSLMLEILQDLSGFRTGDIYDMAANSLGVGLGWLATRLFPDWLARLDRRLGG